MWSVSGVLDKMPGLVIVTSSQAILSWNGCTTAASALTAWQRLELDTIAYCGNLVHVANGWPPGTPMELYGNTTRTPRRLL